MEISLHFDKPQKKNTNIFQFKYLYFQKRNDIYAKRVLDVFNQTYTPKYLIYLQIRVEVYMRAPHQVNLKKNGEWIKHYWEGRLEKKNQKLKYIKSHMLAKLSEKKFYAEKM